MEQSVDPTTIENIAEGGVDAEWSDAFHTRVLAAAMERSRPSFEVSTWEAFLEVWVKNRPAADVADAFGKSVDWVYVAKSRALKAVAEQVRLLMDGFPFFEAGELEGDVSGGGENE